MRVSYLVEKMARNLLCAIVPGIIANIQLQTDAFEIACGMYGGDSDDEEDLILFAGHNGLLTSRRVDECTDESATSEDDDVFGLKEIAEECARNTNSCGRKRRKGKPKVSKSSRRHLGYAEITVPLFTDSEFRNCFHMSRKAFEVLCQKLVPIMMNSMPCTDNPIRSGRPPIPYEKKLLIVLGYFASRQPFRLLADRFEVSKSSVEVSFRRVVTALLEMAEEYVLWPTDHEFEDTQNNFKSINGLQGVLGVLGTLRINLKTAKETPKLYYDSKLREYTVTAQFVCDHKLRFTDCFAGLPGSLSNVGVLRNSDLHSRVLNDPECWFPRNTFVIGSPCYPIEPWLITPFMDNQELPASKRTFNEALDQAFKLMHRAVALLKGRFPRLKMIEVGRLDYLPTCVSAGFVLHNVCLMEDEDEIERVEEYIKEGLESSLSEHDMASGHEADEGADPDRWLQGCEKRNALCNMLYTGNG